MRRIDYVRRLDASVARAADAPGEKNPYAEGFQILPAKEVLRLLDLYVPARPKQRRKTAAERDKFITSKDLFRYMGRMDEQKFAEFRRGNLEILGRVLLRKMSRVLTQIEAGVLVMREGRLVLLAPDTGDEPVPPRPARAAMTFRLQFQTLGTGPRAVLRPTITPGRPAEAPKTMPKLFQTFKLPGA